MSLEQIFYMSQSVAAVAVVASIVYLALQVRQSERIQRAMVQQGRADRASHRAMIMASPDLAEVVKEEWRETRSLPEKSLTSGP